MKKIFSLLLAVTMIITAFGNGLVMAVEDEVVISLSDDEILIDGVAITEDKSQKIYLNKEIETHEDVAEEYKNTENEVIYITEAGTYRITGTITNAQIRVQANAEDNVTLILDNANITCHTAPAILIAKCAETEKTDEAGAIIKIEGENNIVGSHVAEYYLEDGTKIKNDAAISSKVSLIIEGDGILNVDADNEGIESKMHLTINSGDIRITSGDDAINASEDNVSYITINGGHIYAIVDEGDEGDGLDSNGYIVINGGFVVAQANSKSQDSGLDSDLGITINGGTVVATGNMYEGIEETSEQQFMQMYFSETRKSGDVIVVKDDSGNIVLAYKPINDFSIVEFSTPELKNGTYYVYSGGEIEGEEVDGLYAKVTSYTDGTQLSHTGTMTNNGRPGMINGERPEISSDEASSEGMTPPENGQKPEKTNNEETTPPEKPSGNIDDSNRPVRTNNNSQENQERSYEFVLSDTEHVYQGVSTEKPTSSTSFSAQLISNNIWFIIGAIVIVLIIIAIIVVCRKSKKHE